MAEINKQDLISDDALAAPLMLADGFDKVVMSIDNVTASAKKLESTMTGGQTMAKTKQDTDALGSSLIELDKIQKQYSTSTQKLGDEWQSNKKAVDAVNQAVKEKLVLGDQDAKTVNAQTNSLKQLEAALTANRKAYADLGGEQARSSKTGQELLKIIQSQDDASKKLSQSMGQSQKNVGNYRESLEGLVTTAGKVNPELEEAATGVLAFGDKILAALVSPWTALVAAVAGAVLIVREAIDSYLEGTIEGEDRARQFTATWKTTFDVLKEEAKSAGKQIIDYIFGDEDTYKAKQAAILESSRKNAKLLIDVFSYTPVGYAFSKMGLDADTLKKKVDDMADSYKQKQDINNRAAELRNELEKEEIVLIQKTAALTLVKNEEMAKAREKLGNSDQERFEAVKKSADAGKELREAQIESYNKQIQLQRLIVQLSYPELQADQKATDLLKDKVAMQKASYTEVKRLAELEAQPIALQAEAAGNMRRRQALEISIIDDSIKRQLDAIKTVREAKELDAETEQRRILNDSKLKVGNDAEFSVTEQLAALTDMLNAKKALNDIAREKELAAAHDAAVQRVQIDGDTYKQIKDQAGTNLAEVDRLYLEEKNKRVEIDEAYIAKTKAINGSFNENRIEAERQSGDQVVSVIQSNAKYFADIRQKINKDNTTDDLKLLKERYDQGNINVLAYERQRNLLIAGSKLQGLKIATDEAKSELDELNNNYKDKGTLTTAQNKALLDANKKYIDAKAAQDQEASDISVAKDKKYYAEKIALQNQLFVTATGLANNILAGEIQDSQVRINNFEKQKQKELDAAGKNADQQAAINKKYADLETQETNKQLELRKKQAEYDKAIAAVEVVIRTAEAVAIAAVTDPFEIPYILAIGAAQEALILSRPIPQYEKGTKSALGGLSLVGEGGVELVKSPSGNLTLTPNSPSLMDLAKGSQVFTHEETIKMLALGSLGNERFIDGQNSMLHHQIAALDETTKKNGDKITKAIENTNSKLYQQGTLLYRLQENADGNRRMLRIKALGK